MSQEPFQVIRNLDTEIAVPKDGIASRTVFQDEHLKVVLFGFAAGQDLSEHTASMPAIMHFVRGEAKISMGDHTDSATAGTWVHMTPHLPHSVLATTEVVMLLLLLKCGKVASPKQAVAEPNEASH